MTAQLAPTPVFKAFSNDGFPLAYGFLTTYAAGTTTKIPTYTDSTQTTQNTNPIQLNFRGECALWLDPAKSYKFVLTDFFGNPIPGYPVDNIPGSGAISQGVFYGVDSGSANAYVVTISFGGTFSLTTGYLVRFNAVNANTGISTLNVNGTGALSVLGQTGLALSGGEILSTGPTWVQYTGSAWQIVATGALPANVRTAAEIAASVIPVNYSYPPGTVDRYGTNTTPGTTDMTSAFTNAIAVNQQGGPAVTLLATTYLITGASFRFNNAAIVGPGSAICTLKQNPSGFGTGGVVEVGNTALGNGAPNYDKFVARGFTIDGNRAGISAPVDDLHGHGLCLTNITNYDISDVRVINAWNAGVGLFINSNYGYVEARVYNCGNAGASLTPPGFDINACRQIVCDVISQGCNAGARILNNCDDIIGRITIYNATTQGMILQNTNASGNFIQKCILDLTVNTCGSQGILMQEGIKGNSIRAAIWNATGVGCQFVAGSSASANCIDNYLDLYTENGQTQGLLMAAGDRNKIIHRSRLDGRSGAAGSFYAIDVTGTYNVIDSIVDGDSQVRSFAIRATSSNNQVLTAVQTNCLSGYSDSGTSTNLVPTTFEKTITGTFNLTSGAAPTVVTAAVSGVAFGDQVQVAWPSDLQGAIAWAYVQSAGNVTVAAYNITGGALNFGSITVTIRVTKQ